MEKFISLAIALTYFAMAGHASGAPFPVKPGVTGDETLVVRAQGFQIQLGVSDSMIFSVLSRHGYTDIRITKKKLTKARAEACKNGLRFSVEISFDGRIRRAKEIGNCRPAVGLKAIRSILRGKGYRKIKVNPDGSGFIVAACRDNRRFRLSLDQFGDIQGETPLGRCANALTKQDVVALLWAQAYSRVRVENERQGNYSVQACRRDDAVKLLVGRDGAILREWKTGRCDPPIHPATIPALLARSGFTRIDIIDRQLPRYVAHACRNKQRLEVSMNRYGKIVDERNIGRCRVLLNAASLEAKLREVGYIGVQIVKDRPNGFVADVCEEGTRYRLELTRYGETISQKRLGDCSSRRVGKVLKLFKKRGVRGAKLYVEGCHNRKRVKIEVDRYGFPGKREIIGRCR